MIEEQLDRIVQLLEKLVDKNCCSSLPAVKPGPDACVDPTPDYEPDPPKPEPESKAIDYNAISLPNLKKMCADAGKEWPKGTRSTTMAAWLEKYDAQKEEEELAEEAAVEAEVLDDTLADDPFAVEEVAEPEEKIDRAAVTAKLREVFDTNGQADVVDILKNEGGVVKVKDIPDAKLAAVYKSACRSLEG